MKDRKDDIKNKLILLENMKKLQKEFNIELNEEELELKNKLLEIEKKLDSIENILQSISNEKEETVFNEQIFSVVVGAIAIAAATNIIADYFGIKREDIHGLMF